MGSTWCPTGCENLCDGANERSAARCPVELDHEARIVVRFNVMQFAGRNVDMLARGQLDAV